MEKVSGQTSEWQDIWSICSEKYGVSSASKILINAIFVYLSLIYKYDLDIAKYLPDLYILGQIYNVDPIYISEPDIHLYRIYMHVFDLYIWYRYIYIYIYKGQIYINMRFFYMNNVMKWAVFHTESDLIPFGVGK